jgi:hypothetical protein
VPTRLVTCRSVQDQTSQAPVRSHSAFSNEVRARPRYSRLQSPFVGETGACPELGSCALRRLPDRPDRPSVCVKRLRSSYSAAPGLCPYAHAPISQGRRPSGFRSREYKRNAQGRGCHPPKHLQYQNQPPSLFLPKRLLISTPTHLHIHTATYTKHVVKEHRCFYYLGRDRPCRNCRVARQPKYYQRRECAQCSRDRSRDLAGRRPGLGPGAKRHQSAIPDTVVATQARDSAVIPCLMRRKGAAAMR